MAGILDLVQSADWKTEKHVPVIDSPDKVNKGALVAVTATVGSQIPHPNKTEHHISWVELFFKPQDEKFPYQVARCEFSSHGASVNGADSSSVYTHPQVAVHFKTEKPGLLIAISYCNIHGLWQSSKELALE